LIFTIAEHEPEFPGGIEKFYAYLAKNLHYKNLDPTKNITTKIFISFIVEKNGNLSNIKVLFKGFGPKLSEDTSSAFYKDVVGIFKVSPKWKPAIQNGYLVRCRYTVPINIDLAKR
jgi:protein TonB